MKYLFTLCLVNFALQSYTQTKPFDNQGLLVVKVVTEKSNEQIHILCPILTYVEEGKQIRKKFQINRRQTNEYLRKNSVDKIAALHFDFAKNYFVASIPMDKIKGSSIHLENEKGQIIGKKIPVVESIVFDLQKNYGDKWDEFSEKNTPQPNNAFDELTVIKVNTIEKAENIFFELIGNINIKYDYSNQVIFDNREELEEVIKIDKDLDIDFSKYLLVYQRFSGDCLMRVYLYKITNPQDQSLTIKAFSYYGGCRASGSRSFLTLIERPKDNQEITFEHIKAEDYDYLKKGFY